MLPVKAPLEASPPLESSSWFSSTLPSAPLPFSALVHELALELPDFAVWLPPPDPELLAELLLLVPPPVAVAPLLFEALPLPETVCVELPPFPPVAELFALPEFPEVALEALDPLLEELLDLALPVLPEPAQLSALPPLESLYWPWLTLPDAEELFSELVSEEAVELPEVAD